jgi:hypothetical protein
MLQSLISKGQTQLLTFKAETGDAEEDYKARIVLKDAQTGELAVERAED